MYTDTSNVWTIWKGLDHITSHSAILLLTMVNIKASTQVKFPPKLKCIVYIIIIMFIMSYVIAHENFAVEKYAIKKKVYGWHYNDSDLWKCLRHALKLDISLILARWCALNLKQKEADTGHRENTIVRPKRNNGDNSDNYRSVVDVLWGFSLCKRGCKCKKTQVMHSMAEQRLILHSETSYQITPIFMQHSPTSWAAQKSCKYHHMTSKFLARKKCGYNHS